jgi:hypothetical protein
MSATEDYCQLPSFDKWVVQTVEAEINSMKMNRPISMGWRKRPATPSSARTPAEDFRRWNRWTRILQGSPDDSGQVLAVGQRRGCCLMSFEQAQSRASDLGKNETHGHGRNKSADTAKCRARVRT